MRKNPPALPSAALPSSRTAAKAWKTCGTPAVISSRTSTSCAAAFAASRTVFAAVLAEELAKVADAVPIDVLHAEGAGEYAGRCFDYLDTHPELIRLLHWEALTFGDAEVPDEARRTEYYRGKVDSVAAVQLGSQDSAQPDVAHLYALLLAVAHWWFALPQLARMITGSGGDDRAERDRRRATVVAAATRLAAGPLPG